MSGTEAEQDLKRRRDGVRKLLRWNQQALAGAVRSVARKREGLSVMLRFQPRPGEGGRWSPLKS